MRIIARLDVKQSNLIKSVMFDGVRKVGNPYTFADNYYNSEINELMIVNITGSLYGTQLEDKTIEQIRNNKAIPISAGGGIACLDDVKRIISNGADKVVINSLIHKDQKEVEKIVNFLGSASVVGVIEIEKRDNKYYSVYEMARQLSGLELEQTIEKYINLGIGEIVLVDVSRDGCYKGLNEEFIDIAVKYKNKAPILIGGGLKDLKELKRFKNYFSGVVISSLFHYKKCDLNKLSKYI